MSTTMSDYDDDDDDDTEDEELEKKEKQLVLDLIESKRKVTNATIQLALVAEGLLVTPNRGVDLRASVIELKYNHFLKFGVNPMESLTVAKTMRFFNAVISPNIRYSLPDGLLVSYNEFFENIMRYTQLYDNICYEPTTIVPINTDGSTFRLFLIAEFRVTHRSILALSPIMALNAEFLAKSIGKVLKVQIIEEISFNELNQVDRIDMLYFGLPQAWQDVLSDDQDILNELFTSMKLNGPQITEDFDVIDEIIAKESAEKHTIEYILNHED